MREFVYYSGKARTTGNFDVHDLMKAGRMDIACHVVVGTFFLSHKIREDAKLHLVFYGMPDPPKHIEMQPSKALPRGRNEEEGARIDISKKDVAGLIKRILFKYKPGKKTEAFPGFSIEKKSLLKVVDELMNEGKTIYILDKDGEDIRTVGIKNDCVFVLGDHEGLPIKELKRLKRECVPVSIGNRMYFASQVVAIVNNELDRRGI